MQCICLVALIGLPGAGKSTLCTWLLSQQAALHLLRLRHIVHLCYDDHLDVGLPYKEQRVGIFNLLEQLIAAIQAGTVWPPQVRRIASSSSTGGGHILILCDDNFYYRSMRNQLHQLCRRTANCVYGQLHIASSLEACLGANSKRSGAIHVPADVIRQMNERLEPPGSEAWERNSLTLHNLEDKDAILDFISSLLEKESLPSPSATASSKQPAQDQSLGHRLDLLLRARIGELLQGTGPQDVENKRLAGRTLNNKRKQILKQWRGQAENKEALDYYVNLLN